MISRAAPFLIPLLLGATQASPAIPSRPVPLAEGSTLRPEDQRVATMGYALAIAGRDLCPIKGPVTGLLLHHLAEYLPADRPAMIAAGLDRGPGVLAVVPGSPADAAGLIAGDVLLAVDGASFPSPTAIAAIGDDKVWRPKAEASEAMLLDRLRTGPVMLSVLRNGQPLSLSLGSVNGCALRIRLARSSQKGAYTVRGYVVVTTAALALAANDDELAFVIAHELAHIVLGHTRLLDSEGVPRRGLLRGAGKSGRIVRQTEEEADQLGGRIMLAAGYDPGRGALVLPKLGSGPRLGLFETHDSDKDRIRAMQALGKPAAPR
ncbi:MAG: M48 family metalloprotease [Sphingomonas sp.]